MDISTIAVKRHQFTFLVFLTLLTLGAFSIANIPKSEDPTFPLPKYTVVALYPGASPEDIERLVVDPIEDKLRALVDLKTLKTEIEDGVAVIQSEFLAETDVDKRADEVQREVDALRPSLPAELASLEVTRANASNVSILQVALVSPTAAYRDLESLAERLRKRLEAQVGVKDAKKWAVPRQEVRVAVDHPKLARLGISFDQVIAGIRGANVNLPAGSVEAGGLRINVKTSGDYASLAQIQNTPIASDGRTALKLTDVAKVVLRDEPANYVGRYNGVRAAFVTVAQKENQNVFTVERALRAEVMAFARSVPPGVKVELAYDQSQNVARRLAGFTRDFALAIALVLVTLLPLGLRASLIVMLSIPLSLSIGLGVLDAFGFSINQLSIVGFVVALGLLVDDSIVVVENIARHIRLGESPAKAAISATRQITPSVLGCTATLVFAFLPVLSLPGVAGQFIRSLPVAVVVTILASLLVSLTIVPLLASRILRAGDHPDGNIFMRLTSWAVEGSYRPVLAKAITFPRTTLVATLVLFVVALGLLPKVGLSMFPKAGTPQFLVTLETPEGSSLTETDKAVAFVERELSATKSMRFVMANVGKGNPFIYYNVAPRTERSNAAEVFAEVKEFDPEQTPRMYEELRAGFARYPGARIELKEFQNGPPIDAPIAIRLIGADLAALEDAAARVEKTVLGTAGTAFVRNPSRDRKSDLRVEIRRERAAALGVSMDAIDRAVRFALSGITVGSFRERGSADEARRIVVTGSQAERPGVEALEQLHVAATSGALVPLAELAQLRFEASPSTINHFNKERCVTVTANVLAGFNTDRVTREVMARLSKLELGSDTRYEVAGEFESRQESFSGLGAASIIAAFGILAILVLEFGTFRSTLIVASVIPLGIMGGILALYVTGNALSFTAGIGFIALIGIEVKNSILLVDFTNQLRATGTGVDDAIQQAGEVRFVPILLTTLTALGGLVPLALEQSSLYSPLAIVIIGGLLSSTLLARIVTPVMYKLLPPSVSTVPDALMSRSQDGSELCQGNASALTQVVET